LALAAIGLCGAAYLLLWPVRVEPRAWVPPAEPPAEGVYAPNRTLAAIERLACGGVGPEDVDVDTSGRVYGGLLDGRIVRLEPGGGVEVLAATGGRPAGLRFDAAGNLLVCDAAKGLLSISPTGEIATLATAAGGVGFGLCDDLDVAADGTVYFTDASWKFGIRDYLYDFLEHGPNGRLLAYAPATGETRVRLEGLHFANGVAVSPDGAFVLVAESSKYRVVRYWLGGDRRGTVEPFAENLPGVPDGILASGRGTYWVAMASPRPRALDAMLPYVFPREVAARLPLSLFPRPVESGYLVELDGEGRPLRTLQDDSDGAYAPITNAVERDGWLYLGSLAEDSIGRFKL
jgi:sugar lactone lactonase YvrE